MPLKKLTEEIVFEHNQPLLPRLRRLVQLLELRLAALEAQRADYEGAISSMTGVALDRIDETITPLIAQTIEDIRTVASDTQPTGIRAAHVSTITIAVFVPVGSTCGSIRRPPRA